MRLAQVINRLVQLPSGRSNLVHRLAYSERVGVWAFRRVGVINFVETFGHYSRVEAVLLSQTPIHPYADTFIICETVLARVTRNVKEDPSIPVPWPPGETRKDKARTEVTVFTE